MNASHGLPKMVWLARQGFRGRFGHAVDVLNEWLLGHPCPTDFTSALKSGYETDWPPALFEALGLDTAPLNVATRDGARDPRTVAGWAYEAAATCGAPTVTSVHATGGGARLDVLCQLRANVLGVPLHRPRTPDSAFGAAILAAAAHQTRSVGDCARRMVTLDRTFDPAAVDGVADSLARLRARMGRADSRPSPRHSAGGWLHLRT